MNRSTSSAGTAGTRGLGGGKAARIGGLALSGVSAAALALAVLPPGHSHAQSVVDGGSAGGYLVLSGSEVYSNSTFTNFNTTGGSGSGGGAGLGGVVFVGSGATVTISNSDFVGNTATGGLGGVGLVGGSLNDIGSGTPGATGQDGGDAPAGFAYIDGGNGGAGSAGFPGGAGTAGVGGTGGAGGDGSSGSVTTADIVKSALEQAKAVYDAAGESSTAGFFTAAASALTSAAAAAGVGGTNAAGPAPNPALATALTAAATQMTALAGEAAASAVEEGIKAAYELAYLTAIQVTAYELGAAGAGGDGGAGGRGGAGSFGYGGGAGGAGGDGGDAVSGSGASGGAGGDGGQGGDGGFGAGGGRGGDGGDDGDNGSSAQNGPQSGSGGAGGLAGFGGGVGSTGIGTPDGTGGGGGSAYGGAIFVQSGGTLNLTGNILFDGNSVFGGSSANGGASGNQAGSDLFMMTGSTVKLDPGAGNTIVFNGNIADDSKANISQSSIGSGAGAAIEIESGLVIFNGINSYTGQTIISGGVLQAVDGKSVNGSGGIHMDSNINLAGGVLQTSGTFNRYLGTSSGRIQWTGSGGFAAAGGDLVVRLHNGQALTWGSNSFIGGADSLLFGSDSADSDVYFKNAINLAGDVRTVIANSGAGGENIVYMDGVISNGGLVLGDGTTEGIVALTAANTYGLGTTVTSGTTLRLEGSGSIAASSEVVVTGVLDISGSNDGATLVTLSGSGDVVLGEGTLTLTGASTIFSGDVQGEGNLVVAGGTQTLSGVNTYAGSTTVEGGAALHLIDNGDIAASEGLILDGNFDIAGITAGGTEIGYLTGADTGTVALGDKVLTIAEATGVFAGTIGGTGGIVVSGGIQTLSGDSSYTGTTTIDDGAILAMQDGGSIASSSELIADGTFDISQIQGPSASVATLSGSGSVVLDQFDDDDTSDDAKTLVITEASDSEFSGVISGDGGVTVEASAAGAQTFSGINTYLGATLIDAGGTLKLEGDGSIASSLGLTANGTFDIAGVVHPDDAAWLRTLAGDGSVILGDNTLVVTSSDGETFSGVISGDGGLALTGEGRQVLSGNNSYTGQTSVGEGATLAIAGAGDIGESLGLLLEGTFDIVDLDGPGTGIADLAGDGTIELGDKRLSVTAAASTFSGTVDGTGGFAVTSGTQTLSGATFNTSLFVDSTGRPPLENATAVVDGGSIVANGGHAALNIVNGGNIETSDATITADGAPLVYAGFSESQKIANLAIGAGTEIAGNLGAVSDGDRRTLLLVERTGAGSDGIVNFVIDNDADVVGDIIDMAAKTGNGGTYVTINASASWSGLANAASFVVESGASAHFEDGSVIDGNLTAEAGATILGSTLLSPLVVNGDGFVENGILQGNIYILGDLNLSGLLTPGASPGYANVAGDLNVAALDPSVTDAFGPSTLLEVTFGSATPMPGNTGDYDQLNIGGDLNGTLFVELANVIPDGPRSTPLGNLGDIELIRVGGEVNGGVVQSNRLTQHGHEVRIAAPHLVEATADQVVGIPVDEVTFFGAGDIIVYGLEAFVQDETYGLAALTGSTHQASDTILGTFVDRRGSGNYTDMEAGWLRFGASYMEIDDTVTNDQTVAFGQVGLDILRVGDLRAGVLASYGAASSGIGTHLGTARLDGTMYSVGVHANWASGGSYVEAVGQYGFSDWTFSPTEAVGVLTAAGHTATASIEAGFGIGTESARVTPWGQFLYQNTDYVSVESPWIDGVEFLNPTSMQVRGGVRAEGEFNGVTPYAGLAVAHDFSERKTVEVDGFEFGTAMGGTRIEFGAGFETSFAKGATLTTNLKGTYGIGSGQVVGDQGQVGLQVSW